MTKLRTYFITFLMLFCALHSSAQADKLRNTPDTLSISFIGDVMMHSRQLEYDHKEFLAEISDDLKKSNFCAANLEFSLGGEPYSGYPAFSTPDSFAKYLAEDCGIDVFLTANNHILDRGSAGLKRTLEIYNQLSDSLGIKHTGAAYNEEDIKQRYPIYIFRRGINVALINFTYGTNLGASTRWPKVFYAREEEVLAAVRSAREQGADFVIALPHWGTEYSLSHDEYQRRWAEILINAGVDAIIGAHPHVVQDYETIQGKPVIYSLGNVVSNMSARNTRIGLMVTLTMVREPGSKKAEMLEPEFTFTWCSLPGMLSDNYKTIKVKEWASRRSDWLTPSDYDNMIATYERVKAASGIID